MKYYDTAQRRWVTTADAGQDGWVRDGSGRKLKYLPKRDMRNPKNVWKRIHKWKEENPMEAKILTLKKEYGLTYAQAVAATEARANGAPCAVCGVVQKLVVDHNHTTGRYRGLLCGTCNSALGMAKDNPTLLQKLAEYLLDRGYGAG